jgi:hypothetical protein
MVWLLAGIFIWISIGVMAATETNKPIQFYRDRPDCSHPASYVFNGSWDNPMKPGLKVWVCE